MSWLDRKIRDIVSELLDGERRITLEAIEKAIKENFPKDAKPEVAEVETKPKTVEYYREIAGKVYHPLSLNLDVYPYIEIHRGAFPLDRVAAAYEHGYFEEDGEQWVEEIGTVANFYYLFEMEGYTYDMFMVPTPPNWSLVHEVAENEKVSVVDLMNSLTNVKYDVQCRQIAANSELAPCVEDLKRRGRR